MVNDKIKDSRPQKKIKLVKGTNSKFWRSLNMDLRNTAIAHLIIVFYINAELSSKCCLHLVLADKLHTSSFLFVKRGQNSSTETVEHFKANHNGLWVGLHAYTQLRCQTAPITVHTAGICRKDKKDAGLHPSQDTSCEENRS